MSLYSSSIHQIDTRQSTALTVFDGSREDDSKLAKQFWNSVVLVPPVESTLVCKEIRQRTRSRPLNDGTTRPRFSTTMVKVKEEKSFRDKEYDETAVFQQVQDEAKRIQAGGQRHQQVRQLFSKQSKANRIKSQQWAVSQFDNYPINGHQHGKMMYFQDGTDNDYPVDDDRQLVCSLPD